MKRSNQAIILSTAVITFFSMTGVALSETWQSGTGTVYVATSNVGIGTTTPVSKLDLGTNYSDPGNYPNKITLWSGGPNNYFGFGISTGDLDYFSQSNHRFYTGYNGSVGSEKMVINSLGNVGIGTTSPSDRFQVNSIRPILMGNNGGYGVYGSQLGFNMTINTSVVPNTVTKLGGTVQQGGAIITNDYNGNLAFQMYNAGTENASTVNYDPQVVFTSGGNVGIGTTTPAYKLSVNGTIQAKEVKVESNWSDFVFDKEYALPSLMQVESYIKENKHLPGVPSAKEIQDNGLSMAEMMAEQMQKIEELTLYLIDMKKENEELKSRVAALEKGN